MNQRISFVLSLAVMVGLPHVGFSSNNNTLSEFWNPNGGGQNHGLTQGSPTVRSLLEESYPRASSGEDLQALLSRAAALKKTDPHECELLYYKAAREKNGESMRELATLNFEKWISVKDQGPSKDEHLTETMRWATLAYQIYSRLPEAYSSLIQSNCENILTFFNTLTQRLDQEKATLAQRAHQQSQKKRDPGSSRRGRGRRKAPPMPALHAKKSSCFRESKITEVIHNYLTSADLKDRLSPDNIIWQLSSEPFFDAELAKRKRVFLFSLFGATSLAESCVILANSQHATLEKLMGLVPECALSKGQSEGKGLYALAQFYINQGKEEEALKVLERIGTPEALVRCGATLVKRITDPVALRKAITYFKKAETPRSLDFAASLLEKYFPNEEGAYQQAFACYEKSQTPAAQLNMAEYIRYGYHGKEPDLLKALNILLELSREIENPNADPSKKNYPPDFVPILYNNIGSIYELKYVQTLSPIYLDRAMANFKISKSPMALNSLGLLYKRQGKRDKARKAFQKSGSVDARLNLIQLDLLEKGEQAKKAPEKTERTLREKKADSEAIRELLHLQERESLSPEDLGNILCHMVALTSDLDLLKPLLDKLKGKKAPISVVDRFEAIFDYMRGEEEQAILRLSRAALISNEDYLLLEKMLDLREDQEKLEDVKGAESKKDEKVLRESLEDETEAQPLVTPVDSVLDSVKAETIVEKVQEEEQEHEGKQLVLGEEKEHKKIKTSSLSKKQRRDEKKTEKQAKDAEKRRKKFQQMVFDGSFALSNRQGLYPLVSSLSFSFLNKDIEREFEDLKQSDNPKFKELMEAIQTCPWGTQGAGQPEVLRGAYRGYRGVISRHLNDKDRFCYKITPGTIFVLNVRGHY